MGVQERESHGAVVSTSLKKWYLGLIKRLLPQSCALTSHSLALLILEVHMTWWRWEVQPGEIALQTELHSLIPFLGGKFGVLFAFWLYGNPPRTISAESIIKIKTGKALGRFDSSQHPCLSQHLP